MICSSPNSRRQKPYSFSKAGQLSRFESRHHTQINFQAQLLIGWSGLRFFELLGFLPVIGPLARITAVILTVLGTWIGTATAHELKGWRTLVLPLIFIVTVVVSVVFIEAVIEGTTLTIQTLLGDLGF